MDYNRFEAYRQQGIFMQDAPFTLFVLGRYANAPDAEKNAQRLKDITKKVRSPWAVCGFGTNEAACVRHAASNQGHIRVGFENNIWRTQTELLFDNAEMIRHCVEAAQTANRSIASINDVKNIFNL